MPRFHFPIVNGHRLEDALGVELKDDAAARKHAEAIARNIADSGVEKKRTVLAEDEHGDEVGKVAVEKD